MTLEYLTRYRSAVKHRLERACNNFDKEVTKPQDISRKITLYTMNNEISGLHTLYAEVTQKINIKKSLTAESFDLPVEKVVSTFSELALDEVYGDRLSYKVPIENERLNDRLNERPSERQNDRSYEPDRRRTDTRDLEDRQQRTKYTKLEQKSLRERSFRDII
jgi:hypothetical protein